MQILNHRLNLSLEAWKLLYGKSDICVDALSQSQLGSVETSCVPCAAISCSSVSISAWKRGNVQNVFSDIVKRYVSISAWKRGNLGSHALDTAAYLVSISAWKRGNLYALQRCIRLLLVSISAWKRGNSPSRNSLSIATASLNLSL